MTASALDEETLETFLPKGPIHSLRQIQTVYGALAESASDSEIPPGQDEYSLYFTPDELEPFVTTEDEDRYLVSVRVDLTNGSPSLDRVDVQILTRDLTPKLGFSRYPWGRAIDHSITRRGAKGGSDASTVVTYCKECLVRWTNGDGREPPVGKVVEEHADGWVIERLAELGQNNTVLERIQEDVEAQISGSPRVVATVQIKVDPASLDARPETGEPRWFYPGEIPVFNEAMRSRKGWKYITKNIDNGTSESHASCMVTNEEGPVVGTAEDPFALFTVQNAEKFDNFDRKQSWREHPIERDAAALLDASTGFLEACRRNRNGLRLYTLPYFLMLNERRAEALYGALSALETTDLGNKHPMVFLQEQVEKQGSAEDVDALRFYVLTIRDDQGDIFVFNERPDATIFPPRELAESHMDVLESETFGLTGVRCPENWRHLDQGTNEESIVSSIIAGLYARDTVSETLGDDGASANEPSEWLAFAMLSGETVPREWLLNQYVTRLEQEREDDTENRLSKNHVLTQLAQLDALARIGLLKDDETTYTETSMSKPSNRTDQIEAAMAELLEASDPTSEDVPSPNAIREYQLREFLSLRPELNDSDVRRGSFLIGVLLGQLSTHQERERGINRTLAQQYQAEAMTLYQLDELVTRLLDKDRVYAGESEFSRDGSCFPETTSRLADVLPGHLPSDWEDVSLSDVRYHLALGVTYGLGSTSRMFELREAIENRLETIAETN
jgi:hypothetical protein